MMTGRKASPGGQVDPENLFAGLEDWNPAGPIDPENLFAGLEGLSPAEPIDPENLFAGLEEDGDGQSGVDPENLFGDLAGESFESLDGIDTENLFAGLESFPPPDGTRGRDAASGEDDAYSKGLTRVMGGPGLKALMALDAPRSALAATVGAALGKNEWDDVRASLALEKNVSWGDLLPEMTIGRSSSPTGMNVLGATMEQLRGGSSPDFEEREDFALTPWVGFAADVYLDPLNLLGVGVLTKGGRGARLLTNVADGLVTRHLDEVVKAVDLGKGAGKVVDAAKAGNTKALSALRGRVVKELGRGNDEIVKVLRGAGYADEVIEATAQAAKDGAQALGETLAERAKRGQWSALRFAGLDAPKKVNELVAKGITKGRQAVANSPLGAGRFSTKTGNEIIDRGLREVETVHRGNKADILASGKRIREAIDDLTPEAFGGRSSAGWYERVGGVKGQAAIGGIDARQAAMVREVAELQSRQAEEMARRGILGKTVEEAGYAYVPHVAREESLLQRMKMSVSGHGGRPSAKTPHALQREYRWIRDAGTGKEVLDSVSRYAETTGKSVDEVLAASRQASVDEINGALGRKLFSGDLAEAVTVAALRNERALHGARQIEAFLSAAKRRVKEIGGVDAATEKGWRPPKLNVPVRLVLKDGKMFPIKDSVYKLQQLPMEPSMRRLVEGRWKTIAQPEESVKALRSMWQGYIGAWKRFTLFPFLEYHTRNVVGDLWNGWMQGWKPSQMAGDLVDAKDLLLAGKKGRQVTETASLKGLRLPAYGKVNPEEVAAAARRYGVVGSGQYGEIVREALKPSSQTTLGWFRRHFWDLETPVEIGSFLEDQRRMGFFLRRLREGDTFDEAAQVVARTLYDYGDLTDLERQIRTLAVPFYSWYRKNLPKQIENLIRHPGKVAVLPKAKATLERDWMVDPDNPRDNTAYEKSVPNWMEASLPIRWRENEQGFDEFFVLGNWVPTADLFRFTADPRALVTNIVGNLNPPVQKAIEHTFNKDLFRDRPLDFLKDQEAGVFGEGGMLRGNERTNYLGAPMRTTTVSLLQLLPIARLLATLDRVNPGGMFDEKGRMEVGAAGQEKRRPYHVEMGPIQKWLKLLTGLKSYPVDTQSEVLYKAMDMQRSRSGEGLTRENLEAMARKASREGDDAALRAYEILAELLSERMSEMGDATGRAMEYMRRKRGSGEE